MPFATSPPRVISRTGIILFCFQYFMLLFTVIACLREFKDVFVFSVSKWHLWQSVYQQKNAFLPLFCSTLSLDNLIIFLHINSCATAPKTFEVICFFSSRKSHKKWKDNNEKVKEKFFFACLSINFTHWSFFTWYTKTCELNCCEKVDVTSAIFTSILKQ